MRAYLFKDHNFLGYDHGEMDEPIEGNFAKAVDILHSKAYFEDMCIYLTDDEAKRLPIEPSLKEAINLIPTYLKWHCAVEEGSYPGESDIFFSYPVDTDYLDDMWVVGHKDLSRYFPELDLEVLVRKMREHGYADGEIEEFYTKWQETMKAFPDEILRHFDGRNNQ